MRRYGRRRGFNRFSFQVVPEDEVDANRRAPINLECGAFTPDPVPGLLEVANLAHYKGLLAYITFWDREGDWNTIEGTAVIVGPGVALTALHVVSELMGSLSDGRLQVMLAAPTADGGRAWRIRHIANPNGTDAAILSLTLGSRMPKLRTLHQAVMSAPEPRIGEQVMISGFRAAPDVVPAAGGIYFPATSETIQGGLRLYRSVGRVIGSSELKSRLIQVDTKTIGGMSGGAAFNSAGEVFGLLSSSMDHGDGSGTSRVLPLWTIMGANFPDYYLHPGRQVSLFEMHEVMISGREYLEIATHPVTKFKTLTLRGAPKSAIEL